MNISLDEQQILKIFFSFLKSNYSDKELFKVLKVVNVFFKFEIESFLPTEWMTITYEETQSLFSNLNEKKNTRKINGVYYTEKDIVFYILKLCYKLYSLKDVEQINNKEINSFSFEDSKQLSIFDPTCGSGAFLLAGIEIKMEELKKTSFEKSDVENIVKTIYGNDLDEISVLITKIRLFIAVLHNFGISYINKLPTIINKNITCSDILRCKIKQKFDVVLGNPPYVENRIEKKSVLYKQYGNLYADVLSYSLSFLNENGVFGFIIPLSFIATPRMSKLREDISLDLKTQIVLSYADRPGCLFSGVHQKLNILIGTVNGTGAVYTNNYQYFYKEQRTKLFQKLSTVRNRFVFQSFIPKLGTKTDISIFQRISKQQRKYDLKQLVGEHKLYLNMRACFFIKSFISPHVTGEYKELLFNSIEERNYAYCLLNSSLFWWFWICVSDCWHITSKEFSYFKFPENYDSKTVFILSQNLENKLEKTKKYIGTKQTEYEYKHKLCIAEIHAIDDYINALYGLSKIESDYIKNFALPYRMSEGMLV